MDKDRYLLTLYSKKIAGRHLVMGAMGNISVRRRADVWIKREGVWMERAKPRDFVKARFKRHQKAWIRGLASKEIGLHLGCYRVRPDIKAVIHTHPIIITALGTILEKIGRKMPILVSGAEKVAIVKYYRPGSKKLAKAVSRIIKRVDSVILANHGLVTVGSSLKEAYQRTLMLESKSQKFLSGLLIIVPELVSSLPRNHTKF